MIGVANIHPTHPLFILGGPMNNEKRKLQRRHLIYYLRTYNAETGQLLGHLVDITSEGIMLISEEPIEIDRPYQLHMLLPADVFDRSELSFNARAIWRSKDVNEDFYDTGFKFLDITPAEQDIIEYMIEVYGFRY